MCEFDYGNWDRVVLDCLIHDYICFHQYGQVLSLLLVPAIVIFHSLNIDIQVILVLLSFALV